MVEKIKAFSDRMDNFFKTIADNITAFIGFVKFEILILKNGILLFLKIFLLSELFFVGLKKIAASPSSSSSIMSSNVIPIFYTGLIIIVWLILLLELSFEFKKNRSRIEEFLVASFANIFAFGVCRYQDFGKSVYENKEYAGIFIIVLLLCALAIYLYQLQNVISVETKDESLFLSREKDLNKALNYLDINIVEGGQIKISNEDHQRNILGVESPWGNGKTFFVQKLKKKLEEELCVFVEIDVLAYNLDELPKVLVKELDKVLYDNHIMSKYSSRMKDFLGKEKRLDTLYKVFGGKQYSYTETFHGFKDELKCIDKTIFIIYEDLDRIIDRRLIRKIFYISEKLSCEKIKIIYQYSMERLEKLGFDRSYVDKYIPNTIMLSNTSLKEVRDETNDLKDTITNEDLLMFNPEYFFKGEMNIVYLGWRIDEAFVPKEDVWHFLQDRYNIRTIQHFFYDVKNILDSENIDIASDIGRRTMIAFFFVKRFLPEAYKELKVRRKLEDCFLVKIKDETYNFYDLHLHCTVDNQLLQESNDQFTVFGKKLLASTKESALKRKKEVMRICTKSANIEKYIAYVVFNYEYYYEYMRIKKERINIGKINSYDIQNKMIWNMLSISNSLKSDYQKIVDEVKKTEFDINKFDIRNFYETVSRDDSEILQHFSQGDDWWGICFAAFDKTGEDEDNWKKLIDMYWQRDICKNFSPAFIESAIGCMCYLNDDNFKYFMEQMNELEIIGHLNKKGKFPEFLKCVLDRINDYLGWTGFRMDRETVIEYVSNPQFGAINNVYREIDEAIKLFKEQGDYEDFIEMGKVYKKTLGKMNELVTAKDSYSEVKSAVKQENEEFERLKNCRDEELNAEIKALNKDKLPGYILEVLRARKARKRSEEDMNKK